jgi:hypothetical protein
MRKLAGKYGRIFRMRNSGYNTNLASEFHVLSLLHRRGLEANLTLGNKKAVDIVVVRKAGDTATIDVKAVAGKDDWLAGNSDVAPKKNHFVALVTYDEKMQDLESTPRVWVFPHVEFAKMIKRAKAPSTMRYVRRSEVITRHDHLQAWDVILAEEQAD